MAYDKGGKGNGNVCVATYGSMDYPSFIIEPTNVIDLMPEEHLADKTRRTCARACPPSCMDKYVETEIIIPGRWDQEFTTIVLPSQTGRVYYTSVCCGAAVFDNVKSGLRLTTRGPLVLGIMVREVTEIKFLVEHSTTEGSGGKLANARNPLVHGFVLALDSFSMSPMSVDHEAVDAVGQVVRRTGCGKVKTVMFGFDLPVGRSAVSKKLRIPVEKSDYVRLQFQHLNCMKVVDMGRAAVSCDGGIPAMVMPVSGSSGRYGITFVIVFDAMGIGTQVEFRVVVTTMQADGDEEESSDSSE